jgi:hypothetical protein
MPRAPVAPSLLSVRVAIGLDLKRVAKLVGRADGHGPNRVEYAEHGKYSTERVKKKAGRWKWAEALKFYGLTPPSEVRRVSERDLREDVDAVAIECDLGTQRMPTPAQYKAHGRFALPTLIKRLGDGDGWAGVAKSVGRKPVLKSPIGAVDRRQMVADFRRVARQLGFRQGGPGPSAAKFVGSVKYSNGRIRSVWGDFNDLVEAAGFVPRVSNLDKRRDRLARSGGEVPQGIAA